MATATILDLFRLTDQVALVTGGGRGIGRAISVAFADAGADIVAVSRTASELAETAKQVRAKGRRCLTIPTDITVKAQVETAVAKAVREFGHIDILVNNAGGVHNYYLVDELPEDEWDRQVNVNLKAAFLCSQAVGKEMMKQGRGKIINVTSTCAFVPVAGIAPYNAAKAGMNNLTKSLASEWGERGVWVNAIAPGGVNTRAPQLLRESRVKRGMTVAPLTPSNPNRPPVKLCMAEPEEYAPIALFLASSASNHLTGEIISPGGVALMRT